MPIEKWSDKIIVAHLADDPQFTEDMHAIVPMPANAGSNARPAVVLDFTGVTVLNSSNLSALLRLRKAMIVNDARLVLCNISTLAWGTFLVTGLDNIFEFSDNVTTALATLQMDVPRV
jgi:anti-anti-sigma factor